MKKQFKIKIINLLIILVLLSSLFTFAYSIYRSNLEIEIVEPLYVHYKIENFELFIAPNENDSFSVINLFNNAKKEINCVFRSLNYPEMEDSLKKAEESGVKVRLFVNSDYMGNKNIYWPFTRFDDPNRKGMMHSSYCVIDKNIVFSGSLIFNKNTINKNLHSFFVINSEELASRYNSNFWQLYNNQSDKKGSEDKDLIKINEDLFVKPFFCPYDDCESLIINYINSSKDRIALAVYSFTNYKIFNALRSAEKNNITIKGVLEHKGLTKSTVPISLVSGLILEFIKQRVHTKAFVFDYDSVIVGCMNPTELGVGFNDENILLIKNKKVNELYYNFIETIYNNSLRG